MVKGLCIGLFVWAMVALMALIAYLNHKERQLANHVVLTDDGVVLEFYDKTPVRILYGY